jgi:hypothetical protein
MSTLRPSSPALRITAYRLRFFAAFVVLAGVALSAPSCGSNASDVGALCPGTATNPGRTATSPAMSPKEFCQLFLETCNGANNPRDGYTTEADCETAYSGLTFTSTQECRSFHVCNSAAYDKMDALLHCQHAVGMNLCADTAP